MVVDNFSLLFYVVSLNITTNTTQKRSSSVSLAYLFFNLDSMLFKNIKFKNQILKGEAGRVSLFECFYVTLSSQYLKLYFNTIQLEDFEDTTKLRKSRRVSFSAQIQVK